MTQGKNIYQRINACMKVVSTVPYDSKMKIGGKDQDVVSHDAVARAAHGPFTDNGIVCIPNMAIYDAVTRTDIEFVNMDNPIDKIVITVNMPSPKTFQEVGALLSYATKYAILKILMLESRDFEEFVAEEEASQTTQLNDALKQREKIMKQLETVFKSVGFTETDALNYAKKVRNDEKIIGFIRSADKLKPDELKIIITEVIG